MSAPQFRIEYGHTHDPAGNQLDCPELNALPAPDLTTAYITALRALLDFADPATPVELRIEPTALGTGAPIHEASGTVTHVADQITTWHRDHRQQ